MGWVKAMGFLDNFNYHIQGQGEKLVFLHGLMGSGANWRKITSLLPDTYEFLTFDQRGHGRSFWPSDEGAYRPEDYADDLLKILDELGWEKVLLVGHSMGGRNALNFASRFSHRINKLVIEDIGPEINLEAARRIDRLIALVPTPFPNKKTARQFLLEEFPSKIKGHPQADVLAQYFYTNIGENDDGTADWRFSKAGILASAHLGRSVDRWQEVKGLKVPTLVIRGAQSDELSPDTFEKMLEVNPLVTGVEIPQAGHWVHFDQPEMMVRILVEFFEKG